MRPFLIGLVSLLLLPFATSAQSECVLTPLTLPLFDATPVAVLSTPVATPMTTSMTVEEASDVLETYVACTNTGDPTLVWAMFTPRWFSSEFADPETHYLPAFEYEIANQTYEVTNPLVLISVDEVEPTGNGRVRVKATFSSGQQTWTDQLILVNLDGTWLIDDVILVTPPS